MKSKLFNKNKKQNDKKNIRSNIWQHFTFRNFEIGIPPIYYSNEKEKIIFVLWTIFLI